eukprot:397774_1
MTTINEKNAIHNSALCKKKKYTQWKSRWFALYNTRKVVYYEDYINFTKNKVIGQIDLAHVTKISDINEKQIDKKYSFELITPSRTYILGCNDKYTLNTWIKVLYPFIFGKTIHSGWLIKSGENIKHSQWKKRWFVLSNFQEIRYYKNINSSNKPSKSKGMGTILLTNVIRIGHCDTDMYSKYPYSIELITKDRVWILAANCSKTRQIWMNKLTIAMNPFIEIKQTHKRTSHTEVDLEIENKFDGYFEKMDKMLASYYWSLGRTDYYNETNHGKFMLFVTKNELDEADIGEQLDDDAKFNECKYVNMDVKFPLYPKVLNQNKTIETFNVLQYCFKHKKPPKPKSEWLTKSSILSEEFDDILCGKYCESISNCRSLNRLIIILHFCQTHMNKIEQNSDILIKCFENYRNLLRDYGHIMDVHLGQETETNDANFLLIHNVINRFIKCDWSQCKQWKRNNENTTYTKALNSDKKTIFYIDILDTLHSMFIHSYHAGFRIKRLIKSAPRETMMNRQRQFGTSISMSSKRVRKSSSKMPTPFRQ